MRSVPDMARAMGVSPERVRQLIASRALPAVRVGGRWVIEEPAVERVGLVRQPDGRPWSGQTAWGLLWVALARPAPWLSVKQRQRIRDRLTLGVESHIERLAARAQSDWFRGHPSALRRLSSDSRLVSTGASAAAEVGADLVVVDHVEAYVRAMDMDRVCREYAVERAREREGNVHLRVVCDLWPFDDWERVGPKLVVALDLLESSDERTTRAGRTLLNGALEELNP